jgi:uncharacterized protein
MKCPKCDVTLAITDRQGYCPQCRGIWLDRGELDKIIERSADAYDNKRSNGDGHRYPQKKKSFLGDLFDFD